MTIPMIRPEHFARAETPEYDPLWGDKQPPVAATPERELIDNAYLVFANGPGAVVLQDLITKYMARPVFTSSRDASYGYERNGECNVVRYLMDKLRETQQRIQGR